MVVGKGNVEIPIKNGLVVEAYHAPEFSSNIISNHLLSESFKVLQTTEEDWKRCEILRKGPRSEVIKVLNCVNGLYPIQFPPFKKDNIVKSKKIQP